MKLYEGFGDTHIKSLAQKKWILFQLKEMIFNETVVIGQYFYEGLCLIPKKGIMLNFILNHITCNMKKYDNIEDFKKSLIRFYKQEEGLKRDLSYWDYHTSNMDGTIIGERYDNPIRISITKQYNPEFTEQIDENALIEQARQEFFEDCKKNGLNITE